MQNPRDSNEDLIRIPPFEDSHMHFTRAGGPASVEELKGIMDTYERYGIFSLKDMGHKSSIGLDVRKGSGGRVAVRTAGYALFRKGGYGTFLGKGVEGKGEIRRAVKELSDAGADFIKVVNSGIVSSKGSGLVTEGGFTPEELSIICEEAKGKNLGISCHANSDRAIRDAVAAGFTSIEHGFFVSEETIRMMAEKGTSWTPTAVALLSLAPTVEPSQRGYIEEVVERHLSSVQFAATIGVKFRVGTDSGSKGVAHGESFLSELRLWQKAGLSLKQILSAACMDENERKKGNYLLVRKDFISSGKIEAVYRGGVRES
jgi:imidazolonepropionase-like amidohydrolase